MLSVEGANRSLDARWGDDHGTGFPATVTVRLYQGDPLEDGVELDTATDSPGYAAFTVANDSTNFPAAADGAKTTAVFDAGDATGDWDDAPTHAALCDGTDILEVIALTEVAVPADTDPITLQLTIRRGF